MSQLTIEQAMQTARRHHQAGGLEEAERIYRRILAHKPDHGEALQLLGALAAQKGRLGDAVELIRQGNLLRPGSANSHCNLANALYELRRYDEAIAAARSALQLKPDLAEAHNAIGIAVQATGQTDDAIAAYRQAIQLKPDFAAAHNNLANALFELGRFDEAIAAARTAIQLKPDLAEAHDTVGRVLHIAGQADDAVAADRRAIECRPEFAAAQISLGNTLAGMGRLDEAIAAYRQAMRLRPQEAPPHDNLILTLNYHPDCDARTISTELVRWNQQHAEPLARFIQPHANDRDPARRLRIGYVSADFHEHASAFFLLPLLRAHDRDQFEVTCYAQVPHPDNLTRRMQENASHWRSTVGLTDAQVAAQVRQDRIDILVDLKLHTADNRLLVFAQKPAPVQVTWLGYPGTTGMKTIDYRLTDPHLDPPGGDDANYSEQSIRLAETFWCYDPLSDVHTVNALPCAQAGFVTLGCLNNFCKVNDDVLSLWARVLAKIPGSRLLLLAPEGSSRRHVLDRLGAAGIGPQRVEFVSKLRRGDYLRTYHRIDIALDTFPYNGHTTSLDSLWMGLPVITRVGRTAVGRAGLSQLSNLGLAELAAHDADQFVKIAVDLANDPGRLAELRRTLRARMQASPLMDAPRFARNVEAAYRRMWRSWCAAEVPGH